MFWNKRQYNDLIAVSQPLKHQKPKKSTFVKHKKEASKPLGRTPLSDQNIKLFVCV